MLPSGPVRVPETPITLPSGAYGIWPVNLQLGNSLLAYSTAQIFKRLPRPGETVYFFFAIPGVPAEMLFAKNTRVEASSAGVMPQQTPSGLRLRFPPETAAEVRLAGGTHIVVLPESEAEDVWQTDDPALLLLTHQTAFFDGRQWTLQAEGEPRFDFGVFGTEQPPSTLGADIVRQPADGFFSRYAVTLPEVKLEARWSSIAPAKPRPAWTMGPAFSWRPQPIAMAPDDPEFAGAALWQIQLPTAQENRALSNGFLQISYQGDVARLYSGPKLLEDNFWNGQTWTVSLKQLGVFPSTTPKTLDLRILPLPRENPIYLELPGRTYPAAAAPHVQMTPQYQLHLCAPAVAPLSQVSQEKGCKL